MEIVFMGTPVFSVPILESLARAHNVTAVVTQPDRPVGRGKAMQYSAVKNCALQLGLPVLQPERLRGPEVAAQLAAIPAQVFVVVAYGQLLPPRVLRIPPLGCINIHASLLPQYRGAAPMQRAIMDGQTQTGVTIMHMDKGMDTGDAVLSKVLPIAPGHRFTDVHDGMAQLSCACILEALAQLEAGTATRQPQDHAAATYAPMLTKEDGCLDWQRPAAALYNQVRALDPWPGTYTTYGGQMLKVWDLFPCGTETTAPPGTVLESETCLRVATGSGTVCITVLQGPGTKRMPAADYLRGRCIPVGTMLGA